jgi:hypothetical protein
VPPKVVHQGFTFYLVFRCYYTFVGVEQLGKDAWNVTGNKRGKASSKKTVALSFGSCPVSTFNAKWRGNVYFRQESGTWAQFAAGGSPELSATEPGWRRASQTAALKPIFMSLEDVRGIKDEPEAEKATTPSSKHPSTPKPKKTKATDTKASAQPASEDSALLKAFENHDFVHGEPVSSEIYSWAESQLDTAIAKIGPQREAIRMMQQHLDDMIAHQEPFVTAAQVMTLAESFDTQHLQNLVMGKLQRLFDKEANPPVFKLGAAQLEKLKAKFGVLKAVQTPTPVETGSPELIPGAASRKRDATSPEDSTPVVKRPRTRTWRHDGGPIDLTTSPRRSPEAASIESMTTSEAVEQNNQQGQDLTTSEVEEQNDQQVRYPKYIQRRDLQYQMQLFEGSDWIDVMKGDLPPGVNVPLEQEPVVPRRVAMRKQPIYTYPRFVMRATGEREAQLYREGSWVPVPAFPPNAKVAVEVESDAEGNYLEMEGRRWYQTEERNVFQLPTKEAEEIYEMGPNDVVQCHLRPRNSSPLEA